MSRKQRAKRADEEGCKQVFHDFLAFRTPEAPAAWEDGSEPPDYFLTLDNVKYAVEVTTLVEMRQLGEKRYPMLALRAAFMDLVTEVEQAARVSGALRGSYAVSVISPIKDFRDVRDDLRESLLQYISQTHDLSRADERTIYQAGRNRLTVWKYGGHGEQVLPNPPPSVKWEGEAQAEACQLLNEILATKRGKLSRVPLPCVLLIRDAYHFADSGMLRACISMLNSLDAFHSVIVVKEGTCVILSTKEPIWK